MCYYKHLFRAHILEGVERCLSGLSRKITSEMNAQLLQLCTPEEVNTALQNMGPFKASGPGGFLATFYQQNWANIGDEVCHAISNFISLGYMDVEINTTHIVLVPEKPNPTLMIYFHLISLCNVIYRPTSKVLANHLKVVLLYIISPN